MRHAVGRIEARRVADAGALDEGRKLGLFEDMVSTATAPDTSLFSLASRRRCERATTTMPSNAAPLTLALQTPRS